MVAAVSFLLPVRNAVSTLGAAVESCRAQTARDWELVIVDDGSNDGTCELAAGLAAHDARIRVTRNGSSGLAAALNHGLDACTAPYVARIDADDIARPERLEQQLPLLDADPGLGVVDGRVALFSDAGAVPEGMRLWAAWINSVVEPEDFDRALLEESPIVHPAATFRRHAVVAAGGYRAGPFPEDYDLWLRLDRAGWRFRKVPGTLVAMRDHPRRLTRTHPAYARAGFRRVAQAWLLAKVLHEPRRVVLWGAGRGGRPWLRWLVEHDRAPVAIVDIDPRKVGGRRAGPIPVVAPSRLPEVEASVCLAAVGARGARTLIRAELGRQRPDWIEGRDWWHVVT